MIGIVLPPLTFIHEVKRFNQHDSIFNQYKILSAKYRVDFCMFCFGQISNNLKIVDALVYSCRQDSLIRETVSLPRVNIVRNTSYVTEQKEINKFAKMRDNGIHFINFALYSQANKLQNYEYLSSHDRFKNHVPHTKRLSFKHLDSFIQQYGKVIIKPVYGSKGRGISVIEKGQVQYQITQTPSGKNSLTKKLSVPHSQLKQFYHENFQQPASFLVQQWIPFKEFHGHPFDMRAVVQKNGKNKWQLTSRVARVAPGQGQITNLSQGGEMVSFSKLPLQEHYGDIQDFCLETAKTFAKLFPWSAEMGIDLAIDKDGKLWYIETNFCPQKSRWVTIFKTPFQYAYHMYTKDFKDLQTGG